MASMTSRYVRALPGGPQQPYSQRVSTLRTRRLRQAYVAVAAVDTALTGSAAPAAHRLRRLTKPLLMPLLAARLAGDPRARTSPLRRSTLLAEGCGCAGDVLLLEEGPARFAAGASAFGVGHVAYLSGLLPHRRPGTPTPAATAVAVSWLATAPLMARAAGRVSPALGATVLTYSGLLSAMTATAQQLGPEVPARARRLTAAGAALFLLSDTTLGARTFLLRDPSPRVEALVMATYTAGQLLLAEGAAAASDEAQESQES